MIKKNKKYLIFTEIYDVGGIDSFLINLISQLTDSNKSSSFHFTLLCNQSYPGSKRIKAQLKDKVKIEYHNLNLFEEFLIKNYFLKFVFPLIRYLFLFFNIIHLKSLFAKNYNDHELFIVNGGYPGGDSCRAASIAWYFANKRKSLHNFHNLASKSSLFYFIQDYFIDLLVIKCTKKFITVSKSAEFSLKRLPQFTKINNICFIYNGINISYNESDKLSSNINIPQNKKILLLIGTYEIRKGHEFMFNVLNKLTKDYFLICAGYGTKIQKRHIVQKAKELRVYNNIKLLGFVKNLDELILNSDLVVVPSQQFESFGIMCLDAMKHSKALVVTNIGGLPEVVKDGYNGYVVNHKDYNLFAEKISCLIDNRRLAIQFGENGYKRLLKYFTSQEMAKKFEKIL